MIYLVIEAFGDDQLRTMGSVLERLPIQRLAALQTSARKEVLRDPTVLIRLAVGAGDAADPTSRTIIADALSSPTPAVRLAAAMAAGVTRWPDLVPVLESAARREPENRVRRMIQGALDCCRNGPMSDSDASVDDCPGDDFRAMSSPFRGR
jgi:hypothetical protein